MPAITYLRRLLAEKRLKNRFPDSVIYPGASLDRNSSVGQNTVIFKGVNLIDTRVGAFTYIQNKSCVINSEIGSFCSISEQVQIGLAAHPMHMVSSSPVFYDPQQPLPFFFVKTCLFEDTLQNTVVGSDVWIGQRVMVKAGVRIGTGAVIGAGAIVTRDVEPYAIVAGTPARLIRYRFSESLRRRLLNSRWWEEDITVLMSLIPYFSDPERFLEELEKEKH